MPHPMPHGSASARLSVRVKSAPAVLQLRDKKKKKKTLNRYLKTRGDCFSLFQNMHNYIADAIFFPMHETVFNTKSGKSQTADYVFSHLIMYVQLGMTYP